MIILIILIIVLLLSFFFINQTLKKKDNVLEEVKLQENTIKNDGFALMLQQDDGTYKEDTSSAWPSNMVFNSELSGCIDVNGNKIDNSLSFDKENNIVNVSVGKTSYCYVYFDIDNSMTKYLIENISSEELWNSPLEDDGYRFVGTNPDNYICFGTINKNICTKNQDKYMYRIIGIFEDSSGNEHLKLIKKEALDTWYAWNSNYSVDLDWNNSDLYKGINGSYFLTNTTYPYMQNTSWTDKISVWNYTMTNTKSYENYVDNGYIVYGLDYQMNKVKTMYLHELNRSDKSSEVCYYNYYEYSPADADCNVGEWKTLSTKVSLMYASDYALSLGEPALNYVSSNDFTTMKTSWLFINNNDSDVGTSDEWTMTRYGRYNSNYKAWKIQYDGNVFTSLVTGTNVARPVFYLESNVEFSGGTGTINDPFILK